MSAKRKLPANLGRPQVTQSAKNTSRAGLDDSKTVVSGAAAHALESDIKQAPAVVDISSGANSSDGEEEDESEDDSDNKQAVNGDVSMHDADEALPENPQQNGEVEEPEEPEDAGEPSFGDLVRHIAEPIDVAGAFEDPSAERVAQGSQLQPPSGASLGTVLAQALRTNDVVLLESCLHTNDVNIIRSTIQRLESPLAGTLLLKLAERLHKKPGRAGKLMVWVQWSLVTHGGYLATQPNLILKLAELGRVIDERAKGLQPLLLVKGKLDMLEAQIELRRSMQQRRLEDEDDDEAVIYVEGEESEEEAERPRRLAANGDLEPISDAESEVSEDMLLTNGAVGDSEDDEDSEGNDLIDDEAEETEESADEEEVDHDDQDSQCEDDESEDGAQAPPPTKMQRLGGFSSRKR